MGIFKDANLDLTISAYRGGELQEDEVVFSTEDRETAKFVFQLSQNDAPIDLTGLKAVVTLEMGDRSIFQTSAVISKPLEGEIEYIIPNNAIRHYGKATGDLKITYDTGEVIGGLRFYFTVQQALTDAQEELIREAYIEDFEMLKADIEAIVISLGEFELYRVEQDLLNINREIDGIDASIDNITAALELKADKDEVELKADETYVNTELAKKANVIDMDNELSLKADLTYVNTELNKKANATDLAAANQVIATKANTSTVNIALGNKADADHTHTVEDIADLGDNYFTKGEVETLVGDLETDVIAQINTVNSQLGGKASTVDLQSVQSQLDNKANTTHTHAISGITGLQSALDNKSGVGHTHTIADVSNLQTALDGKANTTHTHSIAQVSNLQTTLDGKATVAALNALQAEVDEKIGESELVILEESINGKANAVHAHAITDVTNLQTTLAGKANVTHAHAIADVTNLQNTLDGKASTSHTHTSSQITDLQSKLDAKANTSHTHTASQISDLDDILADKTDVGHTHVIADVTGLQATLNGKANAAHTHTISQVADLQSTLDGKSNQGHTHNLADVAGLEVTLNSKAEVSHTHSVREITDLTNNYYDKTQVDGLIADAAAGDIDLSDYVTTSMLNNYAEDADITRLQTQINAKAPSIHTHSISDVTNLQATLNEKAPATHTHTISQVADLQTELAGKANTVHTHTISQVADLQTNLTNLQNSISGKANASHVHTIANVTGLQTTLDGKANAADITNLQTQVNGKANASHTHEISAVNGLQAALDSKLSGAHTHEMEAITGLQDALDTKAEVVHTHLISDIEALQNNLDLKAAVDHTHTIENIENLRSTLNTLSDQVTNKADASHSHSILDVANLQTALDGKAEAGHVHTIAQVENLQGALDSKAQSAHVHVIGDVSNLQAALDSKVNTTTYTTEMATKATKTEVQVLANQIATGGGGGSDPNATYYVLSRFCTLDGLADDTNSFRNAIATAKADGKGLLLPENKILRITQTVDASFLDLKFEGKVVVDMADGVGLIVGGSSYYGDPVDVSIADIQNRTPAITRSDTKFSLQVQGAMSCHFRILYADSMRLYADGDTMSQDTDTEAKKLSDIWAISYNTFDFGQIDYFYIFSKKTALTIGWINENLFLAGRFKQIEIDGNYAHEQNLFLKPCVENGLIWIKNGNANRFESARTENGAMRFEAGTRRNIINSSFYENWVNSEQRFRVEYDLGEENHVYNDLEIVNQKKAVFDLIPGVTYNGNLASKYIVDDTWSGVNYINGKLVISNWATVFDKLIDTRVLKRFKMEYAPAEGDTDGLMYYFTLYDEDMNILPAPTSTTDTNTWDVLTYGAVWNGTDNRYEFQTNVGDKEILFTSRVKYVQFKIQGGYKADDSPFIADRLTLYAYTPIYNVGAGDRLEQQCLNKNHFNPTPRTYWENPTSFLTPAYVGEEVLDPYKKVWYKAVGLTNTDWVALNDSPVIE